MIDSLKLPPAPKNPHWALTERQMHFLDLTILFNTRLDELYKMAFLSSESPTRIMKLALSITQSSDGREYVGQRETQLKRHFAALTPAVAGYSAVTDLDVVMPGKSAKEDDGRDIEEILAEMMPNAIKDMKRILNDRSDPNYNDTLKIFITKLVKEASMEKAAMAPMRYLPEVCNNCRYKLFVEENIEDECIHCKYKAFGLKNGLRYDHKTQLDMSLNNPDK